MRTFDQPRGSYVCFEGGDGAGKSSLAHAVFERLGENVAVPKRFPSDGIVGSLIRQGLEGKAAIEDLPFLYLFAADGLQEQNWIRDQLYVQGKHVICDRHPTLSGRVYQVSQHPSSYIEAVYNSATASGLSMPDNLFIVDVPADVALDRMICRGKYIDEVFEKHTVSHVNMIRERYLALAEDFEAIVLDGTKPIHELVDQVTEEAGLLL